jgi:hypothetical protein
MAAAMGGYRANTPQGAARGYNGANPVGASPKAGPPAIGGVNYEEYQRKRAAELEALKA